MPRRSNAIAEDVPLFEAPGDPPRAPLAGKVWPAISTWTNYRGKRTLCQHCTQAIHDHGVLLAPVPLAATWRRKGPNGELLLCYLHHAELKAEDDRVAAEARTRRQANQTMRRTIVRSKGYGRTDT